MKKLFNIIALMLLCQLTATAQSSDFNPNLPNHPGQSGWDATTGSLIVTYFTPGKLYDAIRQAAVDNEGRSELEKIRSLTVAGKATNDGRSRNASCRYQPLPLLRC